MYITSLLLLQLFWNLPSHPPPSFVISSFLLPLLLLSPSSSFPLSAFSGIGWPLIQGHLLQEHGTPTVGKPLKMADCPPAAIPDMTAFQGTVPSDLLQVLCPSLLTWWLGGPRRPHSLSVFSVTKTRILICLFPAREARCSQRDSEVSPLCNYMGAVVTTVAAFRW